MSSSEQREQRLEVKAVGYDEHVIESDRQAIRPEKTIPQEYGQTPALRLPEGSVGYERPGRSYQASRVRGVHALRDKFLLDRCEHIIKIDRVLLDLGPGCMDPEIKGNTRPGPLLGQQFEILLW